MTDTTAVTDVDPIVLLSLSAARARQRLNEVPGLIAYVRTLVVPAGVQRSDGLPRSASREAPAPLRVDAVDEADSAYAQLLNWVGYWAETLHLSPPVTASYAWSNAREVQGFRAGVTPQGAGLLVKNLAVWLLTHQEKIERHEYAGSYFDDVAEIVWDLRKKFPRVGRGIHPVLPRACPVCDSPSMGVEWQSDQLTDFTLVCAYCGFEGSTAALLKDRDVREILRDMRIEEAPETTSWWTKKQAVREMRITPQTLNRYIQQDGLKTHTADGSVFVHADQLREIWRDKRMRDQNPRDQSRAS
ncbi:hypothetical protein [Curtobacterium sp. MCBD17_026]|uniref:hypothetical protein n=1 Tax=Curtobacterium sp. MCBD17_026 TaxID=2175621 RepID=UPI000DA8ECCF|nr:hypothetical protein [Curtobacterium sp. MCBD17_026]WIB69784.1 hypothetical protein DEI85_11485 [Curtobacterium sp. MCBD17_026]